MPKNSADLEVLIPILEYYYKQNDWVDNANYIAYIKKYLLDAGIDDKEREPQHYTKRMQVLSYFGFIEWEDLTNAQTKRRITNLGKKFYDAVKDENQQLINEIIVEALEKTTFGRKNYGVPSSDSDVEAPVLCIRAILDLNYISKVEFAYLLYKVQDNGFTYTTVINEIKDVRNGNLQEIKLPEDANKYTDWKPVNFLERFHFLETENSETRINIEVLKQYKNQLRNLKVYNIDKNISVYNSQTSSSKTPNNFIPTQTILYGVPGSGKSYTIKNLLAKNKISSENTMRVVFHPEYTNSDFIGQILPKLKKNENGENVIDYQFTAGPFAQILRKAYCNPDTNFALIIEEINRGNAAAIFGELFQLLDRLDEDDTESYNGVTYTKGWSSYGVHNDCINAYFSGLYDEEGAEEKQPAIHFDTHSAIRLPANLSLFATMNTSDQNVFSLDNAFKRRWDLRLIPNKFVFDSDDKTENKKQFDQCFAKVEGFDFTWGAFVNAINSKIVGEQSGDDISSFEDKQIGMWFVKASAKKGADGKIISKETFMHKVIEYLFDDVFKLDSSILFTKTSLAELIEVADGDSPRSIFANGIVNEIEAKQAELEESKGKAKLG